MQFAGQHADLASFGLWNHTIVLVRLSDMTVLHTEQLPPGVLSRSVLAANLDSAPCLLVGMGDGSVISYSLSWNGSTVASLVQTNKFSIGSQAVQLCAFQSKESVHVFACCDRPAVFYGQSGKIMYSNVSMKDVHYMCGFRSVRCCRCGLA
jgi:DNA damage-binding protein 1